MRRLLFETTLVPGEPTVTLNVVETLPDRTIVRTPVATLRDEAATRLFWETVACLKAAARETGRQGL
jgi:hypothetical protein